MSATLSERPRFYEEQYLGARDLAAVVDHARAGLARHALGGHVWGIAAGLELLERTGSSGALEVTVQPGFAWDGFGRGVWVPAPATVSPSLFASIAFDAVIDGGSPPGRLVDVWLAARFTSRAQAPPGFEACDAGETAARVAEGFQVLAGPRPDPEDRHDAVTVGGVTDQPETVRRRLGDPTAPLLGDETLAEQAFPDDWDGARWLIPLGVVRWLPNAAAAQPGTFVARDAADQEQSARRRRYVGVVAGTVNAARGTIRLRDRDGAYEPTVWSDDLVWVEGSLRVQGPVRILGDALELREASGGDGASPLRVTRQGADLVLLTGELPTGTPPTGAIRLLVGPSVGGTLQPSLVVRDDARVGVAVAAPDRPLAIAAQGAAQELVSFVDPAGATRWHVNQRLGGTSGLNFAETGVADGRLYLEAGGDVGIGTTAPSNRLHVAGATGIRVNDLYFSGGAAGSSLSFNAHRDATNTAWVFPDPSRPAVTIEMDSAVGGQPRFEVWSTRPGATQAWAKMFRINGATGHAGLAQTDARLGIGTETPSARLDIPLPVGATPAVGLNIDVTGGSQGVSDYVRVGLSSTAPFFINSLGNVGIGTAPLTRLHVLGGAAGPLTDTRHTAILENPANDLTASVLALKVRPAGAGPGNNFITFFKNDVPVAAIQGNGGGGILFSANAADYAEWLPCAGDEPVPQPGDVVGVRGGRVQRSTEGADHVVVVSTAPIVAANRPAEGTDRHVLVALLGQVPVRVRGPVRAGDVLLADGDGGVARACRWDELAPEDHARRVGIAWEDADGRRVRRVQAAVGVDGAATWRALAALVKGLRDEVRALGGARDERSTT